MPSSNPIGGNWGVFLYTTCCWELGLDILVGTDHLTNPVLIQDGPSSRDGPPSLVLIHDASGLLTNYFRMGNIGRRTYGIWDPKFDQDGVGSWQCIRDIAETYVRLIRRIVMRGEIQLGGWSFGGVVAVQMAYILATQGRGLRVSRIILIDSVYPRCERLAAQKGPAHLEEPPALPGVSDCVRDKLLTALMRATCLSDHWEPPAWWVPKLDGNMKEGFVKHVIETPGNHYTIFDEPHIEYITANIRKALEICL